MSIATIAEREPIKRLGGEKWLWRGESLIIYENKTLLDIVKTGKRELAIFCPYMAVILHIWSDLVYVKLKYARKSHVHPRAV